MWTDSPAQHWTCGFVRIFTAFFLQNEGQAPGNYLASELPLHAAQKVFLLATIMLWDLTMVRTSWCDAIAQIFTETLDLQTLHHLPPSTFRLSFPSSGYCWFCWCEILLAVQKFAH